MPEDLTLLKTVSTNLNNLVQEMIEVKASIQIIEENVCEIEIENGDRVPKKIKTNDLLKHVYLQTREGGIIDQKFNKHTLDIQTQIQKCKSDHSTTKHLKSFNSKAGLFLSVGAKVVAAIMVLYVFFKMINIEKAIETVNQLPK